MRSNTIAVRIGGQLRRIEVTRPNMMMQIRFTRLGPTLANIIGVAQDATDLPEDDLYRMDIAEIAKIFDAIPTPNLPERQSMTDIHTKFDSDDDTEEETEDPFEGFNLDETGAVDLEDCR